MTTDSEIERRKLVASLDDEGMRLDRFLAREASGMSRQRIQGLIADGQVTLEGKTAKSVSTRLKPGQVVTVDIPPAAPAEPAPEAIPLAVVYEDPDLIVIDKPAGLVVHPAPGNDSGTLVNALLEHCGDSLSGIGGVARPGIVHRLDKDTSGLLVVAKTDRAHQGLAAQFAAHGADGRLERSYLALVWGTPDRPRGLIDKRIGRSPSNRRKMAVVGGAFGRHAVTHYELIKVFEIGEGRTVSLLRLNLETGRTHQIRVHLASMGHPVLGDATYGAGHKTRERHLSAEAQAAINDLGRQALHAAVLGFEHPATGEQMHFESPLPEDFSRLLKALDQDGTTIASEG